MGVGVVEISRDDTTLTITMPVGRNPWIVALGLGVGLPWLVATFVLSIAVPIAAPEELRRNAVLGVIAANLLLLILHVLAAAGVWLAAYKLRGREQIIVTDDHFLVRRRALGVTLPVKLGRTVYDAVEVLDPHKTPGRAAHPRLEVRAGHSAARFGAGLTGSQAEELRGILADEFRPSR